jgi:uncharacterized protein
MKVFKTSSIFTILALIAAFFVGFYDTSEGLGGFSHGAKFFFIAFVLTLLEISLSFDNAVVNASILEKMSHKWQHRFLTWGILVAVFGMRLIFPLAIVGFIAHIDPWSALTMSFSDPKRYAEIMLSTHHLVSAFGGSFLLLVCLNYFFDKDKEVHWFSRIEKIWSNLGKMQGIAIAIVLAGFIILSQKLPTEKQFPYLLAALWGIVTFAVVDGFAALFESESDEVVHSMREHTGQSPTRIMASSGLGLFLYLEVLDASFSFDGVVGAFAITHNLLVIMLGLGSGAFFVRSITIYLVERRTLNQFMYLEHGAFYAIGALGAIMVMSPFIHISEWITGLVGVVILGISIWASKKETN